MLIYDSINISEMAQITLNAKERKVLGKLNNNLRKGGKIPAVIYGHKVESQNLELDSREFQKIFKEAGESTIVTLNVDGKNVPVLIQDVQHHFLKDTPIHVDFFAVNMTEKLTATIPIHFIGDAPAVKALGGILVKNLSEVQVECLPADLPASFEVDISKLNTFQDMVRVSDLTFSDKVKILANTDEVIVTVNPPRSEEELKSMDEKPIVEDVTKVEGVVKPEAVDEVKEGDEKKEVKKEEKK